MGLPEIQLVTRAADFAAKAHRKERRKDSDATPYINHLTEVAWLLAEAQLDVGVVAAGYLHDTIEDVGVSYQNLVDTFGSDVADLVLAVTDDKALDKARRKQLQVDHASEATPRVAALKLADKISNLRSLLHAPPADWAAERIREYVDWAHEVVIRLPAPNPFLLECYRSIRQKILAGPPEKR